MSDKPKERTFTLRFEVVATLPISSIWPDGDAPDDPKTDDVQQVIDDCGGWVEILEDWDLLDGIEGTIDDDQVLLRQWQERNSRKAAKP